MQTDVTLNQTSSIVLITLLLHLIRLRFHHRVFGVRVFLRVSLTLVRSTLFLFNGLIAACCSATLIERVFLSQLIVSPSVIITATVLLFFFFFLLRDERLGFD